MKYAATPSAGNTAGPLQKSNPDALRDELVRHLNGDGAMSGFDFGLQFLDSKPMTYWGRRSGKPAKMAFSDPIAAYSTVTLFARFLGWSTSVPLRTATW